MSPDRILRRKTGRLLAGVTLLTSMALSSACDNGLPPSPVRPTQTSTLLPTRTPFIDLITPLTGGPSTPTVKPEATRAIPFTLPYQALELYPQVNHLSLREDPLMLTSEVPTNILNFSNYYMSRESIGEMYAFYDKIAQRHYAFNYQVVNETTSTVETETIHIIPAPLDRRDLIILPLSQYNGPNYSETRLYEGDTQNSFGAISAIAVGKNIDLNQDVMKDPNTLIALEGANQSLMFVPDVDPSVSKDEYYQLAQEAQDLGSASLTIAFTARKLGLTYEEYKEEASSVTIHTTGLRNGSLAALVFSQATYEEVPMLPKLLGDAQ